MESKAFELAAKSAFTAAEEEEPEKVISFRAKEFDRGMPPPFSIAEIRAAIPKQCWVKNTWRSMSYVVRDLAAVFSLAAAAAYIDGWFVWPLYWAAQGTMFWALFVLGHDCGGEARERVDRISIQRAIYLQRRTGKEGVLTSTACCAAMAALLVGLTAAMGPLQMFKLYAAPYWIFVMWLDFVTYLHHHGHEEKLPWYRGKEWSYLRGALTTVDRDYGLINTVHHDIGTHVIHHLFPQIPHYNLVEASEAAKPVLGKYYREPEKSAALPFHLIGALLESLRRDRYVSDGGDVVYYAEF